MRRLFTAFTCAVALALAGCGNKGDLVVPDKAPAQVKHQPIPDDPVDVRPSVRP